MIVARASEKCPRCEYSATFGQEVERNKMLTGVYVQSVLFDSSSPHFHGDGFGRGY